MKIIPAINCQDFNCVKEKIFKIQKVFKNPSAGGGWIQFDISDGKFNTVKSWNNPKQLKEWAQKNKINLPNMEVHLMVQKPLPEIKKWQDIGAKRFIIHAETLSPSVVPDLIRDPGRKNIGIALAPNSKPSDYKALIKQFNFIQILAVTPGYSGEKIKTGSFEKVTQIKKINPKAKIEIDGGMNEKTLPKAKERGIDFAVSGSYIYSVVPLKNGTQVSREIIKKHI